MSDKTTAVAIKADLLAKNAHVGPQITPEQMELVRTTIAKDATPDELQLFLFDCQRQGVHPLDRLLHFTVRKNNQGVRTYTPITSIDFMRIRAAESGDYAGSDDAVFVDGGISNNKDVPFSATVTVWRMVQGQRCAFVATARWAEYKPEANDFMWRKMPYTMLGKCAEALALRKGFPKQLAGLYAKEEMDQAGWQAEPAIRQVRSRPVHREAQPPSEPPEHDRTTGVILPAQSPQETETIPVPEGYCQVLDYSHDENNWHRAILSRPSGVEVKTKFDNKGDLLELAWLKKIPARVVYDKRSYVTKVELLKDVGGEEPDFDEIPPPDDSNVPF